MHLNRRLVCPPDVSALDVLMIPRGRDTAEKIVVLSAL